MIATGSRSDRPLATDLHMRLADEADILSIKAFYLDRMREAAEAKRAALPIPSLLEIAEAVERRQFVMVEGACGAILAVAGIFRVLEHADGRFLELSGMATHPDVGGLQPHSLQDLMIAVRMARYSSDLFDEGGATSVLAAFARKSNRRSCDNLVKAGLVLSDRQPAWMVGEYVSWFGWDDADAWHRFEVAAKALVRAAELVLTTMSGGRPFELMRTNRDSGIESRFRLTVAPRVVGAVLDTLRLIVDDRESIRVPDLPDVIEFV